MAEPELVSVTLDITLTRAVPENEVDIWALSKIVAHLKTVFPDWNLVDKRFTVDGLL